MSSLRIGLRLLSSSTGKTILVSFAESASRCAPIATHNSPSYPLSTLKSPLYVSSPFSTTTRGKFRENFYNPYDVAETPEEAKELEPPVRYYRDTRFDEPDYDMPKHKALALYAEHQPADLFTDFEFSRDPTEWSYVERLLASPTIPPPPLHLAYPTPSGWVPPRPDPNLPWMVRRKKDHHFAITVEDQWLTKTGSPGAGFMVTTIGGIEGDIWRFVNEAKSYLMTSLPPPQKWKKRKPQDIETTVDEWSGAVQYKGIFDEKLKQFLLDKGM